MQCLKHLKLYGITNFVGDNIINKHLFVCGKLGIEKVCSVSSHKCEVRKHLVMSGTHNRQQSSCQASFGCKSIRCPAFFFRLFSFFDLPRISIPHRLQCIRHLFLVHPTSFHTFVHFCVFLRSRCSIVS